ncbi:MAG: hypothetical protein IPH10_04620 [bacterium]|nr:hypothetical protein [bacterium]
MKHVLAICFCLWWTVQAGATVHIVNVSGLAFSPSTLTINQGDTVRWVKTTGLHNVRESGGTPDTVFYSGAPTNSAFTYNFAFNAPLSGVFSYRCDVHFSLGMTGTITVNAPPPCLAPSELMIASEGAGVRLWWLAPQVGHYDAYSTTDPLLATDPPGAGWTLEAGSDVAVIGQATLLLNPVGDQKFIVVIQDCTP